MIEMVSGVKAVDRTAGWFGLHSVVAACGCSLLCRSDCRGNKVLNKLVKGKIKTAIRKLGCSSN